MSPHLQTGTTLNGKPSEFKTMSTNHVKHAGVIEWHAGNGIAEVVVDELQRKGYCTTLINPADRLPNHLHYLIIFGPYGKLLPVLQKLEALAPQARPTTIYWNTEGLPDLRLPWPFIRTVGRLRSALDFYLETTKSPWLQTMAHSLPLSLLQNRMLRYRYIGDLYHAYQEGWINVIADSSAVYGQIRTEHGLPTHFAPWGITPRWYADLGLERDIDVLWIGKRATRRRSRILNQVREKLEPLGVKFHVADSAENPFVFGDERTRYLNRAKITLNITRTWYDDNFSRFTMAAPNRSLIVSEPLLPHCPPFEAGTHYVAAPIDQLADQIHYYLHHEAERQQMVDNCYQLVTEKLTFAQSIQTLLTAAEEFAQKGQAVYQSS